MSLEALYPFLYEPGADSAGDHGRLLEEAAASSRAKVAEISELRRRALDTYDAALTACAATMAASFRAGGRLLVFGNGGSSTDAAAIAGLFLDPPSGRPLPALSLTAEVAVVTALANDVGFDVVFARQVAAAARRGDMVAGVSTSGGSENVLAALAEGRRRGLLTIGLAGYDGGRMATPGLVDHLFVVPSSSVHRIQEA